MDRFSVFLVAGFLRKVPSDATASSDEAKGGLEPLGETAIAACARSAALLFQREGAATERSGCGGECDGLPLHFPLRTPYRRESLRAAGLDSGEPPRRPNASRGQRRREFRAAGELPASWSSEVERPLGERFLFRLSRATPWGAALRSRKGKCLKRRVVSAIIGSAFASRSPFPKRLTGFASRAKVFSGQDRVICDIY